MMQDHNAHAAFEQSQKISLLRLRDIPWHVIEQHDIEVRRDGTVVDGACVGRLVRADGFARPPVTHFDALRASVCFASIVFSPSTERATATRYGVGLVIRRL